MNGNWTVFTNDQGAAGSVDYVKDEFLDVSIPASNNTSVTSSVLNNPQNQFFNDTDAPTLKTKTLLIKDLVLIQDRSLWISNQPTYRPVFQENFPAVNCYIFGDITTINTRSHMEVTFNVVGGGIAVNGLIRRAGFLIQGNTAAAATALVVTDGIAGNTIDFSNVSATSDAAYPAKPALYFHAASNETNALHDIRITSLQASTLTVSGVQVYYENSGANIDVRPGTTYVNKNKVTSSLGTTLPIPSFGSSLGGVALVYKSLFGGVTLSALSATTAISIATGSSGTNILNASTGTGGSFPVGSIVVAGTGSTNYMGLVQSISTDALTVGPTLSFGVSGGLYSAMKTGASLPIGATVHSRYDTIDFSKINAIGVTALGLTSGLMPAFIDPNGNWAVFGNNVALKGTEGKMSINFLGGSGFLQIDARSSAMSFESQGMGTLAYTLLINNIPAASSSQSLTGAILSTMFTDAGTGWNTARISPMTTQGVTIGISKINLYERAQDPGITFGVLAKIDSNPAYTDRNSIGQQIMPLGVKRRTYSDELYLNGNWTRGITSSTAGAHFYYGTSGAIMQFRYYGKNVGVLGTTGGGTLTIDSAGVPLTFNAMNTVATEGFHTVQYSVGNGGTAIIEGIDVSATQNEIRSLQNYSPVAAAAVISSPTTQRFVTAGSFIYTKPDNCKYIEVLAVAASGGGGGSGNGGDGGDTTFGSLTVPGGKGGGSYGTQPGAGGAAPVIPAGMIPLVAIAGGPGGSPGTSATTSTTPAGGHGGTSFFGGPGNGGNAGVVNGASPSANSGSGGGGGVQISGNSAAGGGAGAFAWAMVTGPNTVYSGSIGTKGTAGASTGAAGSDGAIYIMEFY